MPLKNTEKMMMMTMMILLIKTKTKKKKMDHIVVPPPSCVVRCPYLFYPHNNDQWHGKWLVFGTKGPVLDTMWSMLISKWPIHGVSHLQVSTARPHSHARDSLDGVIMVHCLNQSPDWMILDVGKTIISILNYTSSFGKLFYKTRQQCMQGTYATNQKHNYTFALPVNLPSLQKEEEDVVMISSFHEKLHNAFKIPFSNREFAAKLGAIWNPQIKKWCAPNSNVHSQLSLYFESDDTVEEKVKYIIEETWSCLSINLWMSGKYHVERMLAIFQCIERHHPDLLCLQELTCETFDVLHPLLTSIGFQTRSQFQKIRQKKFTEMLYFNTMTMEPSRFEQVLFPQGTQYRELHLLTCTHKPTQTSMICATAHLEPGVERQSLRLLQMQFVLDALMTHKLPWIFAGDTNLCYYQDIVLPKNVFDAWEQTGRDSRTQGTWNPRQNTNLQSIIANHVGMCRFDRILYHSMSIKQFDLVCQQVVELIGIHPSDHFGILAHFTL